MAETCACGCGGSVTAGRRFVAGHNMRVPATLLRAGKRVWTADEEAELRRLFPHEPTAVVARKIGRSLSGTYQAAYRLGLHKSEAYLNSPASGRLQPGDKRIGHWSQFKKGQVPPNKGLRRPGWAPGRMRDTQFKKGEMRGQAQRNWKPIGTERISKDGYLERKVHDADYSDLPPDEANRKRQRRWVAVHRIVWEAANGPVPKGHKLTFRNGDKRDIRLDNLECVSDAEWMKRNTVHRLPKPLAQTIQLLGALNRKIRKQKREAHAAQQD